MKFFSSEALFSRDWSCRPFSSGRFARFPPLSLRLPWHHEIFVVNAAQSYYFFLQNSMPAYPIPKNIFCFAFPYFSRSILKEIQSDLLKKKQMKSSFWAGSSCHYLISGFWGCYRLANLLFTSYYYPLLVFLSCSVYFVLVAQFVCLILSLPWQ